MIDSLVMRLRLTAIFKTGGPSLENWMIEKLRQREEERQQPVLQIHIDIEQPRPVVIEDEPETEQRGVIIIDLL